MATAESRTEVENGQSVDKPVKGTSGQKALPKAFADDKRVTRDIELLRKTVEDEFAKIGQGEEDLEKRRKDRIWLAKAGNAVQIFMSDFSQFLDAYSGICNVAKAADAKYGGLVTESLSLLLIVNIRQIANIIYTLMINRLE